MVSLKSMFFEEEPQKKVEQPVSQPIIQQIHAVQAPIGNSTRIEEFKGMFLEKVQKLETTKTFFQFLDTVKDLRAVIPDEVTAIKSAFVGLKRANIQPGDVVTSAQRVLSQLNTIKQTGEHELTTECNHIISTREGELQQATNDIASVEKQLTSLTAQLTDLKTKAASLSQEVKTQKDKTADLIAELNQAYTVLSAEFNSSVSKVTSNAI